MYVELNVSTPSYLSGAVNPKAYCDLEVHFLTFLIALWPSWFLQVSPFLGIASGQGMEFFCMWSRWANMGIYIIYFVQIKCSALKTFHFSKAMLVVTLMRVCRVKTITPLYRILILCQVEWWIYSTGMDLERKFCQKHCLKPRHAHIISEGNSE